MRTQLEIENKLKWWKTTKSNFEKAREACLITNKNFLGDSAVKHSIIEEAAGYLNQISRAELAIASLEWVLSEEN